LVFTANLFALMGLRQLYFLLGGLLERLAYLHYGIAAILGFIGVKLIIHAIHEAPLEFIPGFSVLKSIPEVPICLSLSVILVSMAGAVLASLLAATTQSAQVGAGGDQGTGAHDKESRELGGHGGGPGGRGGRPDSQRRRGGLPARPAVPGVRGDAG